MSTLNQLKNVCILLAPGFEEGSAIYCVEKLRAFGLSVSLVSLSSGLVNSKHGVSIKPDYLIDEMDQCQLVLIPGGTNSTASLMTDPRTHLFLEKQNGFLAAMETAVPLLKQFNIPTLFPSRFITKCPKQALNQFTTELIEAAAP